MGFEAHTNLQKVKFHFANGIEQNISGIHTIALLFSEEPFPGITDLEILGTPPANEQDLAPLGRLGANLINKDWELQRLSVPANAFFKLLNPQYLRMPDSLTRLELLFEQTTFNRETENKTDLAIAIDSVYYLRRHNSLCPNLLVKFRLPAEHFGDHGVQEVCKIGLCDMFPCAMVDGGEPDSFIKNQDLKLLGRAVGGKMLWPAVLSVGA